MFAAEQLFQLKMNEIKMMKKYRSKRNRIAAMRAPTVNYFILLFQLNQVNATECARDRTNSSWAHRTVFSICNWTKLNFIKTQMILAALAVCFFGFVCRWPMTTSSLCVFDRLLPIKWFFIPFILSAHSPIEWSSIIALAAHFSVR